jgi:hypothetical protein|tara:strand:+ start:795 stop:1520 length:726 start_codon:yes stop_codon:yes gene_type:complete
MGQLKREGTPIITDNLSDASSGIVLDALDAGMDIDEIAPDIGTRIRAKTVFNQENLDEVVGLSSRGAPIAGQSLMNSQEESYPWEKPAEFANPREALDDIVSSIMQPEAVKNVVMALSKGAAAADIATAVLYSKFTEGKINPDVMMMLVEPVMYLTMAIGEEANIKYNIEGNDLDEIDNEDTDEATEEKLKQFENIFTQIKNGVSSEDISELNTEVVPENMLSQIKEKGPEIRSMLSKGEA